MCGQGLFWLLGRNPYSRRCHRGVELSASAFLQIPRRSNTTVSALSSKTLPNTASARKATPETMARPTPALRQWLNLRRSLSSTHSHVQKCPANSSLSRAKLPTTATVISDADSRSRQCFHSGARRLAKARQSSAKPAPALQRKRRDLEAGRGAALPASGGRGTLDAKGFFMQAIEVDDELLVREFLDSADSMYDAASADGLLPGIGLHTFKDVVVKIFKGMDGPPNPRMIQAISKGECQQLFLVLFHMAWLGKMRSNSVSYADVDAVYRIGIVGCTVGPTMTEWLTTSCALAGARAAIVLIQARLVKWTHSTPQSKWTDAVKRFSDEGYPPAMMLHAKILGMRGQYQEAFELMEKRVLPFLTPTRRRPPLFNDITLDGSFESPYRLYALLHASYDDAFDSPESRRKADEATRVAALEYNDRMAMVEYASIMMNEKKLDDYEKVMSKAAMLGSKQAVLYIANFYYQVFHGRYPTLAERRDSTKPEGQTDKPSSETQDQPRSSNPYLFIVHWITSFFNQGIERETYRDLAKHWYTLGHTYRIPQASFMLALMAHEKGVALENNVFLEAECAYLLENQLIGPKFEELKDNWYNPQFVPRLSVQMLAVR
ncbi:hypothetical protein N7539_007455 [Penicillium diatomitis]|uniref:Uncharacterized protein n=1 Tax=Penicillium diatomitis TaxID=2819901 RepID=A0A9W9WV72_9EURO|nr:uncharacterized protein N7539_007455 [Penicillium diatomitis]KAJ5477311.1 hypothetical protein N7539_007455 [Penicillium diatomitis]